MKAETERGFLIPIGLLLLEHPTRMHLGKIELENCRSVLSSIPPLALGIPVCVSPLLASCESVPSWPYAFMLLRVVPA